MRALVTRLGLGVPEAVINLRRLMAYRRELINGPFGHLITQTAATPAD